MEIVEEQSKLLTDFEVLQLLRDLRQERLVIRQSHRKQNEDVEMKPDTSLPTNVATVDFETEKYLNATPSQLYSKENVRTFLEAFKDVPLTKAEKLMVLNIRPTKIVHLYPLIEEVEIRFPDEGIAELLQRINNCLPQPPEQEQEADEDAMDTGQEADEGMEE